MDVASIFWLVIAITAGCVIILAACLSFFTVEQQTKAIIQRLGKFARIASPGLNLKIPFIETVAGRQSLRVQQLDVDVETKTKDNVFVKVMVSVQYYVLNDKVYEAFYKLESPAKQIRSFVFDVVRANVPKIELDTVFETKDEIAKSVKDELSQVMDDFGYGILQSLVTDIDPDSKVKESMNEINAAQRLRVAATEKGEAEKILRVKDAEAESESKRLQGEGIAKQRKAIIDGLRESVELFATGIGVKPQDVMSLVLMTQYFDTLQGVASSSMTKTIFLPHSPGGLGDIQQQIMSALATVELDPQSEGPQAEQHQGLDVSQ